LVGFAWAGLGTSAVRWGELKLLGVGWLASPVVGGIFAYLLMQSLLVLILRAPDPCRRARLWAPVYVTLTAFAFALLTVGDVLKKLGIQLGGDYSLMFPVAIGIGTAFFWLILGTRSGTTSVEERFGSITIFTMCFMAFAHGSNDVTNAVGPMSLVFRLVAGVGDGNAHVPTLLYLVGGVGIVVGLASFGYRVVHTIGFGIAQLTPCRAFVITLATTLTVMFATRLGFPVSTTHTVVGAVFGVGLANGLGAVRYATLKGVGLAWLITFPVTALLSAVLFFVLGFL
jgi:inorganic phosphate transporter, PiT family